jgi:Stage II sporulation protein E (SpoIIE)
VKRLTDAAPEAAIVVLTRATTEQLGAAALSAGAKDYLIKGRVDEQLLARSVRYAIERHRAAQLSRELVRADRQRAENARLERTLTPTPAIRSSDISVLVQYQAGRRGAQLGGDFHDAIEHDDGTCAVLVGDVVGHGARRRGVGGPPPQRLARLALAGLDQVAILGVLEGFLRAEGEQFTFASLAVLVVDEDRCAGSLVLAGHPPLMRLGSPSSPVGAGAHGPLVGVMPEPRWSRVADGGRRCLPHRIPDSARHRRADAAGGGRHPRTPTSDARRTLPLRLKGDTALVASIVRRSADHPKSKRVAPVGKPLSDHA